MEMQKSVLLILVLGVSFQNAYGASSCLSFYKRESNRSVLDILGVNEAIERVRTGKPLPRASHELYDVIDLAGAASQIKPSSYFRVVKDGEISVEPDMTFVPRLDREKQYREYIRNSINKDEIFGYGRYRRQESEHFSTPDIYYRNNHGPNDSTVLNVRDTQGRIVKSFEVIEKINAAMDKKFGALTIIAEGMVPLKVNSQTGQALVSFTGRQKFSFRDIRAIDEKNPAEMVYGRPESQRLGVAVIDLKNGQIVKAALLPHEIDAITSDSNLSKIYGVIDGELGGVDLWSLSDLPPYSSNIFADITSQDAYRRKFQGLVERDLDYLGRTFGIGYAAYSTIFSNFGKKTTPAISAGRFDKGIVLTTTSKIKFNQPGLSDVLHFVISPSSGVTTTFTVSLNDLMPKLFTPTTLIKKLSVIDFREDKLVLHAGIIGNSPQREHLIVMDYAVEKGLDGGIVDFKIKNVNFDWAKPDAKSNGKVVLANDGSLFEIGQNENGKYLRSLRPGLEEKRLKLPNFDRLLGIEVSDLGNVKAHIFHGGQFKTIVFNLDSLDAI
ncbi:MAG: hypothetical protein JNL11_11485 [Bdellovibrionaceae bacterium]|nr:hypothetical protein [Pseudobdellovibrionaceae bacterium]